MYDFSLKVLILVRRSYIFNKSTDFDKEVFDFLRKVMILVRRSDIFEKQVMILIRRCDSDLAKP